MRHKQQRLLEQNIQYLENYIIEHDLNKNLPDSCLITPESMILSITEADPDQANFKNSKWLIKNLLAKNFLWEDIEEGKASKAYDTLSRFLNIRKQWPESNLKDINQYTGLSGIAEKIRPFEITKGMNELKREEKARIYEETIVVYDKNDYLVVIPKTQEASCFWGRNTEWCTASTQSANYFNVYNLHSPLIIAITPDNRKYQFHKDSDPMDENDTPIKNITDPVLGMLALQTGKIEFVNKIDYTDPLYAKLAIQSYASALTSIRQIPSDIENYLEICKIAIQKNVNTLEYIPKETEGYFELCKLAVQQNGYAIQHISSEIEGYLELCKLAVQQDGKSIWHISSDTEGYPELCELAIQQNGSALEFISKTMLNYQEFCFMAVKNSPLSIYTIPRNNPEYYELWKTTIECHKGFNYNLFEDIPHDYEHFIELAKLMIKQNPAIVNTLYPYENSFKDLLYYAVECDTTGHLIELIPLKDRTSEMYKQTVRYNGLVLEFIDSNDPDYSNLCWQAVHDDGLSLKFVDKNKVENYDELCKIAVNENPKAIQYVSFRNENDPSRKNFYLKLCQLAIEKNPRAILNIPSYSVDEKDIYSPQYQQLLKSAIEKDGQIIQKISRENPEYYALFKIAIRNNGEVLSHYPISFVDEKLKQEYLDCCKVAIESDPHNIMYVYKKLPEYKDFVRMALEADVQVIEHIPDCFVENYDVLKQRSDVIKKEKKHLEYKAPDWFIEKEHESIGPLLDSLKFLNHLSYQKTVDI